ncbi:DNA polymerase ligase N-terminal domain-containing protein [Dichotomicrobium thermohalophilum]|uniref:DNA ligase D-like protein (Predicted 3'-phosphoesterase) n=1 Tax=Dichotomicrobium thermohalophilum TaxID=933063 RepID=A0A397Q100_9HYPH|nr:DNA polymerase ligase N-terminal domain-containing protein [Dichotomicrobium thermohalophilum]RIA55076.1 DNA ligase D-like protein (predicted 3'-phosphoesterase) [Dichotomicrobium thermohalophilum]
MPGSEYREKRDFEKTLEPEGGGTPVPEPIFVIQEHEASTHHFDFRLEADGVLKSWSVPKGPSLDPEDKRLAVPTEDHPLAYADFEGAIPEGEYGAGTVLLWDTGPYENITEKNGETVPVADALADGHLLVRLHGEKIKGGYALQRIATGEDERWLLIKMNDSAADARRNPVSTEQRSVKSGRTMKEIAREEREPD